METSPKYKNSLKTQKKYEKQKAEALKNRLIIAIPKMAANFGLR
jgi:hypothetical protein